MDVLTWKLFFELRFRKDKVSVNVNKRSQLLKK